MEREDDGHFGTGAPAQKSPPFTPGAVLTEASLDGHHSFVLEWQENPPLDRFFFLSSRLGRQTRVRDGARSDSSETEVRTHHIPVRERVLKSFFLHSCSLCCSELVERRQKSEGTGSTSYKKCKFFCVAFAAKVYFLCVGSYALHSCVKEAGYGSDSWLPGSPVMNRCGVGRELWLFSF